MASRARAMWLPVKHSTSPFTNHRCRARMSFIPIECTTVYIQELNVIVIYNVLRYCVVTITVPVSHRGSFSASVRDGWAVEESHGRVDHVGVHQEHNPPQPMML